MKKNNIEINEAIRAYDFNLELEFRSLKEDYKDKNDYIEVLDYIVESAEYLNEEYEKIDYSDERDEIIKITIEAYNILNKYREFERALIRDYKERYNETLKAVI